MIEIVEFEFNPGFDGQKYCGKYGYDDLVGINDALFARMMGWSYSGPRKKHYKQVHRYDCSCKCPNPPWPSR